MPQVVYLITETLYSRFKQTFPVKSYPKPYLLVYQFSVMSNVIYFLARLRFIAQDSVMTILRRRYGDVLVKKIQKLLQDLRFSTGF